MKKLFTEIAPDYDRLNHILSLGRDRMWRHRAVAKLEFFPVRVLDLACGTGDLTFAIAERFSGSSVVGLDLTPAMLDKASVKLGLRSLSNVSFVEGNALDLSPIDGSFDLISCAFGIRNMPDKRKALHEAAAKLVPEGKMLVMEFFRPSSVLFGAFTRLWLKLMVAIFAWRTRKTWNVLSKSIDGTLSEKELLAIAFSEGLQLERRFFFFPCCTCLVLAK